MISGSKCSGQDDLLCAYYPEEMEKEEVLKQFLDYLSAGGELFESCGLYPLEDD